MIIICFFFFFNLECLGQYVRILDSNVIFTFKGQVLKKSHKSWRAKAPENLESLSVLSVIRFRQLNFCYYFHSCPSSYYSVGNLSLYLITIVKHYVNSVSVLLFLQMKLPSILRNAVWNLRYIHKVNRLNLCFLFDLFFESFSYYLTLVVCFKYSSKAP